MAIINTNPNALSKTIDPFMSVCVAAAMAIGFFAIGSAASTLDQSRLLIVQGAAAFIGIALIIISLRFDYEYFGRFALYILILSVLLLVAVLFIGQGGDEVGTKGWIRYGSIGIQPSEIAKIGFIISFAKHIDTVSEKINKPSVLLGLLAHGAVVTGLVLLQPDYGTAMVFIIIMVSMLFLANISPKYILIALLALAVIVPLVWSFGLQDFQRNRFFAFLSPESDPLGSGYHVSQSKIAIGAGGVLGSGLFNGVQTQLGYLPEKQTDFVFAVIGEEMGFWGTTLVLLLLVCITAKCFSAAKHSRDLFGTMLCAGVGAMFFFHVFENIFMCIGLAPVTGIPLPFVSYGGSNLLTSLIGIGLVMNVRARRRRSV